jgi:parallel beta-helix repeat protein
MRFAFLFSLLLSSMPSLALEVTVSPNGSIPTLKAALDAIRAARAAGKAEEPAVIVVNQGSYFMSEPLVLEKQDAKLTVQAEPGGAPLLIGAVKVANWGKHAGNIMKANVGALLLKGFLPKQLFCNGERQILARYPNFDAVDPLYGGWAFVERFPGTGAPEGHDWKRNLYLKLADVRTWAHPEDVEINVFAQYGWWNFIEPVESLDAATRKLTLKKPCSYDLHPNNRFHFQNAREELDAPGEWYFDKRSGLLYFWPTVDIKKAEVWLPVAQSLIQLKGTADVRITGIDATATVGSAIVVENSDNCVIERCRLDQCGGFSGSGVSISNGSACRVTRCEISRTGSGGVGLTGGDRKTLEGPGHKVDNCHIHHVGVFNKNGPGISLYGVDLTAEHNHIHDCPRMGVQMSGNNCKVDWNHIHHVVLETQDGGAIYTGGRDWISSRGTSWSYNLIHDVVGCGQEEGGLKHPWFTFGLYPDDNSGGLDIIGNIVFRCASSSIHMHNSRDCVVENNIFSQAGKYTFDLHGWKKEMSFWTNHRETMIKGYESVMNEPAWKVMRGMDLHPKDAFRDDDTMMSGNVVRRNIVVTDAPGVLYADIRHCKPKWNVIDENLAWSPHGSLRTNVSRVGADIGADLLAGTGSFTNETPGTTPKGWGWNHRPGKVELKLSADGVLVADSAVSDDPKNAHSTFHSPSFPARPGAAYRVKAKLKGSLPGMKLELAVAAYEGGKGYWQAKGAGFIVGPEWQSVEVTARLPREGDKDFRDWIKHCWVRFDSHAPSGTVSVDDLSITEAEPLDEWSAWQAEGWDQHSVVADPLFLNPPEDGFRLHPTSPAFRLGFKRIPFEKMGIMPE